MTTSLILPNPIYFRAVFFFHYYGRLFLKDIYMLMYMYTQIHTPIFSSTVFASPLPFLCLNPRTPHLYLFASSLLSILVWLSVFDHLFDGVIIQGCLIQISLHLFPQTRPNYESAISVHKPNCWLLWCDTSFKNSL